MSSSSPNINPQESLCISHDGQATYDGGDFGHLLRRIEGPNFSGRNLREMADLFNRRSASCRTAVHRPKTHPARSLPVWRRVSLIGFPNLDRLDLQERSITRR